MTKEMKDPVNVFAKICNDTSKEFALTPKELYLNLREAEESLNHLESLLEKVPVDELESYKKQYSLIQPKCFDQLKWITEGSKSSTLVFLQVMRIIDITLTNKWFSLDKHF